MKISIRWFRQLLDFAGSSASGPKAVVFDTDTGNAELRDKVPAAEAADAVPWAGVASKPATFPPASHQHVVAEITDFRNRLHGGSAGSIYRPEDVINGGGA